MSAPQFTLLIRNRIHECAPDHSVETITVGELRKAATTMAELYEALEELVSFLRAHVEHFKSYNPLTEDADAALAKARGETL